MRIRTLFLCFISLFFTINTRSAAGDRAQRKDAAKPDVYSAYDVRAGERLFYGLTPSGTLIRTINCASCHNTGPIDTLNWSPSAMDLAAKYANLDFASFRRALMEPTGKVMSASHDSLEYSDLQLRQMKSYLTNLYKTGMPHPRKLLTNRIIFVCLILLFLLAFIDFALTHRVRYTVIPVAVMLLTVVGISYYLVTSAIAVGRSEHYQPDQPIKFSHRVHVGQNKTDCLYCHYNAQQSKYAGIPPASVCMNCHVIVKEGARSGKFEINKLVHAVETNTPIAWVKVHNLPDHVYFSHAQHVVAGKLDCAKCHGDVASMDQIVQVKDLSMGWCVNCHRQTKVQFDNPFYAKYKQLHEDMRSGKISTVTAARIGGTDCMKCHY